MTLPATIPSTYSSITVSRKGYSPDHPVRIAVEDGSIRHLTPDNAKALAAALLEAAETPKTKVDRIRDVLDNNGHPRSVQRALIRNILDEDGPL